MTTKQTVSDTLKKVLILDDRVPLDIKTEGRSTDEDSLVSLLYKRLTSTKFRKSSVDDETAKFIRSYLSRTVRKGEKLRLYFLFGGYKQARLSTAPYPDWAEFFTIGFALKTASYIESIYPNGVEVIYRGDEVVITKLDNYTKISRENYKSKFDKLLSLFTSYIPSDRKISLRYELTSETSPEEKLFPMMEQLYTKYEDRFNLLPPEIQEEKITKSYRNQCWNGEVDLTNLSDVAKRDRAKRAFIMHDAFLEADVKIAQDYFDNGVSITYRRGVPGCLHFGSCSSSSVQFWAGEGWLVKRGESFIPWIYSYEQLSNLEYEEISVNDKQFIDLGFNSIKVTT